MRLSLYVKSLVSLFVTLIQLQAVNVKGGMAFAEWHMEWNAEWHAE